MVGCVLCDSDGQWIRGFAMNIGVPTTLVVKLWDFWDSLMLANSLYNRKIKRDIDAKSAVDILQPIRNITITSNPYIVLIDDCGSLI